MIEQFQFDTSGVVLVVADPGFEARQALGWDDLSPGVQGCIAAMKTAHPIVYGDNPIAVGDRVALDWGFFDLHRDTLARIIADWGEASKITHDDGRPVYIDGARGGRAFWEDRQAGIMRRFPPVTIYLPDDGKVCLKDRDA